MVEHGDIRVVHCGGSKINFRDPVITHDSRFLLCASGEAVKVFSTSTEECIHELRGHTGLVTGVLLRPSNHLQVQSPLHLEKRLFSRRLYPETQRFQLVAVHLPQSGDQMVEAQELSAVLSGVNPNPAAIAFGRGGEFIASVNDLQLEVYFFKKQKSYRFFLKEDNKKGGWNTFTCVACHPKDDCIATGHEDGKIRLWRNFNHKKEYTYSTLHWHHSTVSSLCFTPEGTNLLSGGVESVLVQWRYNQESERDFLPRLGGAITHITVSPDGSLFCTSHSDNKITIIQSCVKVSAVIQGLVKGDSIRTDLMMDPRSKALVLNGKPGHLQFYSLQRDKLLYNLDIVQQEYIHESGLQQFEVVKAAFDASGSWLATVEERHQKAAELELNLKLWAFDEQTQSFVLNTTISAPHDAQITAMCFCQPTDSQTTLLVSTSKDGHFKAWQLAAPAHTEDEGPSWLCDFVSAYHGLVPECCSFSADGSLLAVVFQEVVTVWSPSTWELLTTLSQPPGAVSDLCFGRLSCSKYLLGTTASNLLCWNLLTCSLEWTTSMDVRRLVADPLSENMAAFCYQSGSTDLFVFKPSEPRPLFSHKAVCSGKVTQAVFAPREEMLESCEESSQWLNRSQLYFLTQQMKCSSALSFSLITRFLLSPLKLVIDDSVAMTPFYLLLGKHRQQQQEHQDSDSSLWAERTALPQTSASMKELLQTPAHVLPSTSYLCSMFVQSLLISVSDAREEKAHAEEEMESEKEEEDSEEEMESSRSKPELAAAAATESDTPALTKAQARELRRVRKLDHSWLAGLLDS
uniref:WD repeat-containing protein 75 second beta-propeller domain-containing protein n=1 Tax=Astatotilapia calliptera TaxID=8154 RepID=A0AAX7VIX1_ASTCA